MTAAETNALFTARVGHHIQLAMAMRNANALQLAGDLRVPRGVVVDWMKGRCLTLDALADIAQALNVHPEQLVTGMFAAAKDAS